MTTLREAAQALERARGCITGLLARTPVRDVTETLAEIDSVIAALAAPPPPAAETRLAEIVLSMQLATPAGLRARSLAREILGVQDAGAGPVDLPAEEALRSLASWLGVGGYNAPAPIDAELFERKIRDGVEMLVKAAKQPPADVALLTDEEFESIAEKLIRTNAFNRSAAIAIAIGAGRAVEAEVLRRARGGA